MDIISRLREWHDFHEWKVSLRTSETGEDGTYEAPSRAARFGRAFRYWFVSYENRRGHPLDYQPVDPHAPGSESEQDGSSLR